MIDETLDEALKTPTIALTNENININKLLNIMENNKPMTAKEIMNKLKIKSKETLRKQYLNPQLNKD